MTHYERGDRFGCVTVGEDQEWSVVVAALCGAEVFGTDGTSGCLGASSCGDESIFGAKSDFCNEQDWPREDIECRSLLVAWTHGVIL